MHLTIKLLKRTLHHQNFRNAEFLFKQADHNESTFTNKYSIRFLAYKGLVDYEN